ncbi:MAG: hypothetical protein H0V07_01940 [Propionibacteriales bacterium]|nr:hypothetical protein [Propionibacteriales bacterium]
MISAPARSASVHGTLKAVGPFDLRTSIRFLSGFGACKGDQVLTPDTLTKAIGVDGQCVVFRLSTTNTPEVIAYSMWSRSSISTSVEEAVGYRISEYLSLTDDLSTFYAAADQDHEGFRDIVSALRGLHQVRFLTLAEISCWVVLTQRTPRTVSLALKRRLVEGYGGSLEIDGVAYRAFPELGRLCEVTSDEWKAIVRSDCKADYLEHVVHGVQEIGEEYLRTVSYADATKALRSIRGIGEFGAAAILLRGLGRMDYVPMEMPSFKDAAVAVYGPGVDTSAIVHRYGTDLGYWAYYLHTGLGALREDIAHLRPAANLSAEQPPKEL